MFSQVAPVAHECIEIYFPIQVILNVGIINMISMAMLN